MFRFLLKITRYACVLLALLCTASKSYSQFTIDIGGTYIGSTTGDVRFVDRRPTLVDGNMTMQGDTSYYKYNYSAQGAGIFLYPKVQLADIGTLRLSVGMPISVAASGTVSSYGSSSFSYLIDINGALDLNGGNYNGHNYYAPFGYYVGIGAGVTNTNAVSYEKVRSGVTANSENLQAINSRFDDPVDYLDAKTGGLMVHAGIGNFTFLENAGVLRRVGFRASYRPSFDSQRLSYFMGSVLLHF